jgi:hypothetical protein
LRRPRPKLHLASLVACCLLLAAPAAFARPGTGARTDAGRLRLGLELGGKWDSMAVAGLTGNLGGGTTSNPGDGIGLLRGRLSLDTEGPRARLKLAGNVDWNRYLGLVANTTAFSFIGAQLEGLLDWTTGAHAGVTVGETLRRSDRMANPLFTVGVIGLSNAARARGWWRPGGGALEFGGGLESVLDIFGPQVTPGGSDRYRDCGENPLCNPLLAAAYDAHLTRAFVDAKWRVFPKSGFTAEASYGRRTYLYGSYIPDTAVLRPVRALAGFGTLLSTRTSFAVKGGYGGLAFENGRPMIHDWLAQAEAGYQLNETFSLRGGWVRSNEPVAGANLYYRNARSYVEGSARFARVTLTAQGANDLVSYGGSPRQDRNLSANGNAEWRTADWFTLALRGSVTARDISGVSPAVNPFTRWDLGLGAGVWF